VTRRIDQVKQIFLPVPGIFHLYGMTFDGDSTFPFQVHVIQHLVFSDGHRVSKLQQTVSQGAFTVVDVSYDAEISNVLHYCERRMGLLSLQIYIFYG